jgi:malate dehydrogenase
MDVALIGAGGVCGRQYLFQILNSGALARCGNLQLVGHHGGDSEKQLWGLRADAIAAFDEVAPPMQVVLAAEEIKADLVVMMAGATISTDPNDLANMDRSALTAINDEIFTTYATELGTRADPPIVLVQSNPVEHAVAIFSQHLPRRRVLGAAGLSDSTRFRLEVARDLGLHRADVRAMVLGQHGDFTVPIWSHVLARGVSDDELTNYIAQVRAGRELADLPDEIRSAKATMLDMIYRGEITAAHAFVSDLPADVRFAVLPFFIHYTAGRTTEGATAHSAAVFTERILTGTPQVVSAQVRLAGDFLDLHGVTAIPVITAPTGWTQPVATELAEDEKLLLQRAVAAAN